MIGKENESEDMYSKVDDCSIDCSCAGMSMIIRTWSQCRDLLDQEICYLRNLMSLDKQ